MAENQVEKIKGTVEEITYYNEDNGYCIFKVLSENEEVTVVGNSLPLAAGVQIEAVGKWTVHHIYGVQFSAEEITMTMPENAAGMLDYLSSGIIRGIGPGLAQKIVEEFGTNTFDVLQNDLNRLASVKGISRTKAREFQRAFIEKFGSRETLTALINNGLTHKEALNAYKIFKEEAAEVFCDNPFSFVSCGIISFERCEDLADENGISVQSSVRAEALVTHIVEFNIKNGHTCLPRPSVVKTAISYLDCSEDDAEIAIDTAIDDHKLVNDEIDGKEFLFIPAAYEAEHDIADRIKIMVNYPPSQVEIFQSEVYSFESANGICFDEKQRTAIETAVNKGLLILTGGPGTGKTTTVKGMIALMKNHGLNVALAAPTGRAAKRMSELTGCEAKTLHRLLEAEYRENKSTFDFARNRKNPLEADAVIIDELSMVDVFMFSALLDALPLHSRLILVGDKDQLPPVGAGNVLADLRKSGLIPVVELDKIFRQAMKSRIVTNAHLVVKGEMPVIDDNSPESDFFLVRENSQYSASSKIADLVTRRIPSAYGFDPVKDIQVLCPSRMGELGSQNINHLLQKKLNPPQKEKNEITVKGYTLREGDKVMQIKNNYDVPWFKSSENGMGVFNGDVGVLTRIDKTSNIINVVFEDKEAMYSAANVQELELAYAITVHKSQGSEFDAVVMPVLSTPPKLAYRNLFYTALTRAKKLLVLCGNKETVADMVKNDKKSRRYSALLHFLTVDNGNRLQ